MRKHQQIMHSNVSGQNCETRHLISSFCKLFEHHVFFGRMSVLNMSVGKTNRECVQSQLPSFCLNSDRLTFLSVTCQAGPRCAATTHTRRQMSNWIPWNAGERAQSSCMRVFAEVQVRGAFSFMCLNIQRPWSHLACSCLHLSTHCCCQGCRPAAGLLCVWTSAERERVVGLGVCGGA